MTYDPDLFRGAAAFYDRYRAPYAGAAVDFVIDRLALDNSARLLDLGSGPGTLARRFAMHVKEVLAIDPDPDMLAEGRRLAEMEGIRNIVWMQAGSAELGQLQGLFKAVVMGQSFHWMDRDQVLRDIQRILEEDGGIALINPGRRRPQETWEAIARPIIDRYRGPRKAHPQRNSEPDHEPALQRSAFEIVSDVEFATTICRDVSSILGAIYSNSDSVQAHFGARRNDFERDLGAALLQVHPFGEFCETIETGVLVAKIPTRAMIATKAHT